MEAGLYFYFARAVDPHDRTRRPCVQHVPQMAMTAVLQDMMHSADMVLRWDFNEHLTVIKNRVGRHGDIEDVIGSLDEPWSNSVELLWQIVLLAQSAGCLPAREGQRAWLATYARGGW